MVNHRLHKHYRGALEAVNDAPMHQWTPEEVWAPRAVHGGLRPSTRGHRRVRRRAALSPVGTFRRYGGEGRPPVTDGLFAETKDLIAGCVIDVDAYEPALELADVLSATPGAGGRPIHERREVRPLLGMPPTFTERHTLWTGPAADPQPAVIGILGRRGAGARPNHR